MERYVELKPLGKGSFGSVSLVREKSSNAKLWVLKRVGLDGLSSSARAAAFQVNAASMLKFVINHCVHIG
eukprot:6206626-Pleurochrysis_carterae.AAC.4